jgi:hypothetical protein
VKVDAITDRFVVRLREDGLRLQRIASAPWIGAFENRLGIELPKSFSSLVKRYTLMNSRKLDATRVPSNRIAAIGDSCGDIEMLKVASLPFFVGMTVPFESGALIHLPRADLRVVAERILQEWT